MAVMVDSALKDMEPVSGSAASSSSGSRSSSRREVVTRRREEVAPGRRKVVETREEEEEEEEEDVSRKRKATSSTSGSRSGEVKQRRTNVLEEKDTQEVLASSDRSAGSPRSNHSQGRLWPSFAFKNFF